MPETLLKIGEKAVINGITMTCTESPYKGCKGCDALNMNVTCDDWLCSSKHHPDGKDTIMLAERFNFEGKTYVRVPFVGCCACAFGGIFSSIDKALTLKSIGSKVSYSSLTIYCRRILP